MLENFKSIKNICSVKDCLMKVSIPPGLPPGCDSHSLLSFMDACALPVRSCICLFYAILIVLEWNHN